MGSRYRMNLTSKAPVISKYGATHDRRRTSALTPGPRNGNVASIAATAVIDARAMAKKLVVHNSSAAGRTQPRTRYPAATRGLSPRRATYSKPNQATRPNGHPRPQVTDWRIWYRYGVVSTYCRV